MPDKHLSGQQARQTNSETIWCSLSIYCCLTIGFSFPRADSAHLWDGCNLPSWNDLQISTRASLPAYWPQRSRWQIININPKMSSAQCAQLHGKSVTRLQCLKLLLPSPGKAYSTISFLWCSCTHTQSSKGRQFANLKPKVHETSSALLWLYVILTLMSTIAFCRAFTPESCIGSGDRFQSLAFAIRVLHCGMLACSYY